MKTSEHTPMNELAMRPASFIGDRLFHVALLAAPVALMLLTWLLPSWREGVRVDLPLIISIVLWQPVIEELLFRGVLQGQLAKRAWGRRQLAGFSVANAITTVVFVLAHLVHHTLLWAAGVIIPSLVFGYFRDRYRRILPAFLLHAFYNGCYLSVAALR